jgi:hypothetical protein
MCSGDLRTKFLEAAPVEDLPDDAVVELPPQLGPDEHAVVRVVLYEERSEAAGGREGVATHHGMAAPFVVPISGWASRQALHAPIGLGRYEAHPSHQRKPGTRVFVVELRAASFQPERPGSGSACSRCHASALSRQVEAL